MFSIFDGHFWPYSRVFDRVVLLVIIICLWLFRGRFSLTSIYHYFSSRKLKKELPKCLLALFVASFLALVFLPYYVNLGELKWSFKDFDYWLLRVPKILLGAILISLIEETFFRGLVFVNLKKVSSSILAASISSFIYALVHFVVPVRTWEYPGLSLSVGFEYLAVVFTGIFNSNNLAAFFGLFLVGIVLCRLLEKSGSLLLCICIHAGWVIAIKLSTYLTESIPGFIYSGGRRYYLVGKPLVWVSIIAVFTIVSIFLLNKNRQASSSVSDENPICNK
ncbi:MAG: CPBP family intramembrane metalloprotease [Bdellovibrionales bacterium]|nr:CPBP family intramembrane metalloprotease [Bdellovibrionales bacterium]